MGIEENIRKLEQKIERAAQRVGRSRNEISIVAVSKTVSVEKINEALGAGIKIIGENRVQEAKEKFSTISNRAEWHMVGHLQTNKVRDALKIFSLIHGLDSIRLAEMIEKRAAEPVGCLVEVNTSKEPSKFGITPKEISEFFDALTAFQKIKVLGLMTIGPGWAMQDPEASRSCFRLLYELRQSLSQKFAKPLPVLSMGMTSDFEVAIEEGATMIRVGTAIFGPRDI